MNKKVLLSICSLALCSLTLVVGTLSWWTNYQSVDGDNILVLQSGESIAYLKSSLWELQENNTPALVRKGGHIFSQNISSTTGQVVAGNPTVTEDIGQGKITVTFEDITNDISTALLHHFDTLTNYDSVGDEIYFDASYIPSYYLEIRVIKNAFNAFLTGHYSYTTSLTLGNGQTVPSITSLFTMTKAIYDRPVDEKTRQSMFDANDYPGTSTRLNTQTPTEEKLELTTKENIDLFTKKERDDSDSGGIFTDTTLDTNQILIKENGATSEDPDQSNAIDNVYSKTIVFNFKVNPLAILDIYTLLGSQNFNTLECSLSFDISFESSSEAFVGGAA